MIHYINHSGLRNKQLTQQPTITTRYKIIFMGDGASTSPCVWSSYFKSIIFTLHCSAHWFRFTCCKLGEINLIIWSEFTFSHMHFKYLSGWTHYNTLHNFLVSLPFLHHCAYTTQNKYRFIISVEAIQRFKGSLMTSTLEMWWYNCSFLLSKKIKIQDL